MSHFALVENGIVTEVIVSTPLFIMGLNNSEDWIQTSYNTHGGEHPQGKPMRMNFASIGSTYDRARDVFIPPKPYDNWILNEETCLWESPSPYPTDGKMYEWNEETTAWVEVN